MRTGTVYYRDRVAGELVEDEDGYLFRYAPDYLVDASMPSVSLTLPKRAAPYRSPHLFSSFSGLLAEGVQKAIQCRYLRIDEDDEFGRLLATSRNDCIGAVYVVGTQGRKTIDAGKTLARKELGAGGRCRFITIKT